jgi:HPt (histidine-containing phosphotransfer) domain-containing protein
MYSAAMQEAAATGDLTRMKQVAREAEEHIAQHGNVPAALEALKLEIAKMEKRATT